MLYTRDGYNHYHDFLQWHFHQNSTATLHRPLATGRLRFSTCFSFVPCSFAQICTHSFSFSFSFSFSVFTLTIIGQARFLMEKMSIILDVILHAALLVSFNSELTVQGLISARGILFNGIALEQNFFIG